MSQQEHTTLVSELEWARIWVLQASGFDQPWWNKERAKHELDTAMVKIEQVQTALKSANIPIVTLAEPGHLIARAIAEAKASTEAKAAITASLANALLKDNETFDAVQFIRACGIELD